MPATSKIIGLRNALVNADTQSDRLIIARFNGKKPWALVCHNLWPRWEHVYNMGTPSPWRIQLGSELSSMADQATTQHGITRRRFLMGLPIGILGALAVGIVSGRATRSVFSKSKSMDAPKNSIFTPSRDRYPQA